MNHVQKTISIILIISIVFGYLAFPAKAEARGFFNNLLRFLRRTTNFIIKAPGKIAHELTRPLGPFLGPIAADVLLANAPNRILRIIDKAQHIQQGIDTYDAQVKKLGNAQKILRDRAEEVRQEAEALKQTKTQLEQDLLTRNISLADYQNKIVSLDQIVSAYEERAQRLDRAANNLKVDNLLGQVAADALHRSVKNIGNVVTNRINNEIKNLMGPDIIKKFVGEGGMNVENVIDLILTGDIIRVLESQGHKSTDPDFKNLLEQLKKDIKEQMKNDRKFLQGNWRELLDKKIKEILDKNKVNINKAANANAVANTNTDANANANEEANTNEVAIPVDENGCKPGYTWDRMSGVGCKQTNCYNEAIPNAHWSYEGYCVCGSSGSIDEKQDDPNKECAYPSNYAKCPGCVYECVKFTEDCSLEGIVP